METIDERTFKQKIHDGFSKTKQKVEDGWNKTKKVITDHPVETLTVVCMLGPSAFKLANSVVRRVQQGKETRYNECDYYDPRTGEHWVTNRPLTAREKLILEQRYSLGESKGEILNSMRKLKWRQKI